MGKLNRLDSRALGTLNTVTPVCLEYEITADASSGLAVTVPFAIKIIDVIVISTASVGSATVKLTDGTNDITDAIVAATDTNVVRAGTIDDAYNEIAAGGTLKVVTNGASDRADVYIMGVRND